MRKILLAIFFLPFLAHSLAAKICLTMVVHNQEATISQCLESVKELVDCVSVYDVGSTDNTVLIIKNFLNEAHIPGKIHESSQPSEQHWSFSIYSAQKTIKDFGFSLSDFYLLTLDANKSLKIQSNFKKDLLSDESYSMIEKASNLGFCSYTPHLFKASLFWDPDELATRSHTKLSALLIGDLENSISKTRELENNIQLWTQSLAIDSKNPWATFSLAESHLALGHYDEAIRGFQSRIDLGGNLEELWLSKYKLGECYENKGEWDRAFYWYLEAYQHSPDRAESIQKIATHYRGKGENQIAYIFAKHGLQILSPELPNLFPFPPLYDYQFDEELSIVSFYTRYKEDGLTAANDLILKRNVPGYVKDQTYANMRFYIEPLKNIHYKTIQADLPLIEDGFDERYHPMNPSILKTEDGYKVICRAVNYTQTGAKIFNTIDAMGIFRTRNFLLTYSPDFELFSQKEIIEDLPRQRRSFLVEGLEDCRLFRYNDRLCFTTSSWNTHDSNVPQISFCRLESEGSEDLHYIDMLTPLFGPDLNRCEKNWLPFVLNNDLYLIYGCDPFTIFQPDLETGKSTVVLSYEPDRDFSRFRGAAAPIPFGGGYLMLVHEVSFLEDFHRCYYHRFLYLNAEFNVEKVSNPFVFKHFGVEFCSSMILDHTGTQLILGIGIEDREAYLGFMDIHQIYNLLKPL